MKGIASCIAMLTMASAATLAQSGADALSRCLLPSYEERMRCLEKLAGGAPPPPPEVAPVPAPAPKAAPAPAPTGGKWVVSETRSPLDYSPVVDATVIAAAGPDGFLQISIHCHSGGTEMAIRAGRSVHTAENDVVSYSVNNKPWVVVLSGQSPNSGIELKGDVPGFLATLPPKGKIVFRLANKQGPTMEGAYDLSAVRELVTQITGPCNWRRR